MATNPDEVFGFTRHADAGGAVYSPGPEDRGHEHASERHARTTDARLDREAMIEAGRNASVVFKPGIATPGSETEAQALARLDELREDDQAGYLQDHPDASYAQGQPSPGPYRTRGSRRRRRRLTESERAYRRAGQLHED